MRLPKRIELLYVPAQTEVEAHVVTLTKTLIRRRMGNSWWNEPAIDPDMAAREIDRHWDWSAEEIEREGQVLKSRRLAVITGDGAVQGGMLVSTEPVTCEREPGASALFVGLLFVAPRNRHWIRGDRREQYRGVGVELLRSAAELSDELGFEGRLKLDASPGFVGWYAKRGLLEVSTQRIVYEDVAYTPMELDTDRVSILLPEH
jgi:hypothetical protein